MKQIWYRLIVGIVSMGALVFCAYIFSLTTQVPIEVSKPIIVPPEKPISFLFLGDMMVDRSIRTKAENQGYDHLFACMKDFIKNYHHVIVNLEGSVTRNPSVSQGAPMLSAPSFRFTFDPQSIDAAYNAGITIFGIANNHIYDFGKEGIAETGMHFRDKGIQFFGDPQHDEYRVLTLPLFKKGIKNITFVPFNEFFGSPEETLADIVAHPDSFVVVFSHWGDEYVPPAQRLRLWAYQFIDAGADVVIGHHPHVVLESEEYNGKRIYYSLGNFIFDQYWEEAVRTGLAVGMTIDPKGGVVFEEFTLDIKRDGQTCPRLPDVL